MGMLKCPICGEDLELAIDVVGTDSRKINNNGKLHKVINRCTAKPNTNSPSYLRCSNRCGFTYDTEHASKDETIKELDNWINQHLEEISKWE